MRCHGGAVVGHPGTVVGVSARRTPARAHGSRSYALLLPSHDTTHQDVIDHILDHEQPPSQAPSFGSPPHRSTRRAAASLRRRRHRATELSRDRRSGMRRINPPTRKKGDDVGRRGLLVRRRGRAPPRRTKGDDDDRPVAAATPPSVSSFDAMSSRGPCCGASMGTARAPVQDPAERHPHAAGGRDVVAQSQGAGGGVLAIGRSPPVPVARAALRRRHR